MDSSMTAKLTIVYLPSHYPEKDTYTRFLEAGNNGYEHVEWLAPDKAYALVSTDDLSLTNEEISIACEYLVADIDTGVEYEAESAFITASHREIPAILEGDDIIE